MLNDSPAGVQRLARVLFILVFIAQVWVIFTPTTSLLNWYTTDDSFYYYKVAQNIVEGRGSTFDGVNLSNGYHPLWMLICVPVFALARFDLILPLRILTLISILVTAGTSVTLFRLLSRSVHLPIAFLAGAAWALLPQIARVASQQGMESGINAFFVILLLERTAALRSEDQGRVNFKRYMLVGLIAALAILSRLDNVFVVLAVGLWLIFSRQSLGYYWLAYLLAAWISVFSAFFLRLGFVSNFNEFLPGVYAMLAISVLVKPIVAYLLGLCSPGRWRRVWRAALAAAMGSGLAGAGALLLSALGIIQGFPRSVILWDAALSAILFAVIYLVGNWLSASRESVAVKQELGAQWALSLRRGLAYSLPVIILLGGYLLWNQQVFGTASPVSGQTKQWWGTIPDTAYGNPPVSFAEFFGLKRVWGYVFSVFPLAGLAAWVPLAWAALLALGWLWGGRRHAPGIWPLLAACLLQITHYHGGYYVGMRPWYWVNELLLLVLVTALVVDGLWLRVARVTISRWVLPMAAGICVLALGTNFEVWMVGNFPLVRAENDRHIYISEAIWLEQNTPPGSVIGMSGGGSVAYFIRDRRVINLDGLINSYDYFQQVKAGEGRAAVDKFGLDFVYGNGYLLTSSNPYYNTLKDRLTPLGMMNDQTLFRYAIP